MKRHIVHLTDEQRAQLTQLIHSGSAPAQAQTRARILLLADRGAPDADIATALLTSIPTVQRTRARFCTEGQDLQRTIYSKPRSGRPIVFGGDVQAHLTMLACSDPPPGRARWTLQLLADTLVELHVVESISDVQVGKMLKKTSCAPGAYAVGASPRPTVGT